MRAFFTKWLTPPTFEGDEEKTRLARLLNSILAFLIVADIAGLPLTLLAFKFTSASILIAFFLPALLINIATLAFLHSKRINIAWYIFLGNFSLAILGIYTVSPLENYPALFALLIIIAFANIFLSPPTIIRLTVFIVLYTLAITFAHTRGWIPPLVAPVTDPLQSWGLSAIVFTFIGFGVYLSSLNLRSRLESSIVDRQNLQASNKELADLRQALETRVQERTADLEKRAIQLHAVSNVASAIATAQALDDLLPMIVNLVSDRFGFYHTGIFLLDEANEYAVLRAANSAGGQKMLKRGHQLALDTNSMVGYAILLERPRIASDVGEAPIYFDNPDLPNTRSEIVVPLRTSNRTIGALDVQSVDMNAFSQDDIETFAILADQIAIAIENARLLSETDRALAESHEIIGKYVKQEWARYSNQIKQNGFIFDGKQVSPLVGGKQPRRIKRTAHTGQLSLETESAGMSIPIKLRGQVIGVLDVRSKQEAHQWTDNEIALLEAAADRAAFALENARLVESAQRRVAREQAIGEIAGRVGAINERNSILQAAVEELGRKLGNSEILIELETEEE